MPSCRYRPFDDEDDEPPPVRDRDGRWPTLDRVEQAIRWPGALGAHGWFRDALLERRAEAEAELVQVDAQLASATRRRRQLVTRIRNCNLALVGTNEIRDPETGELRQVLSWARRIPFADPQPHPDRRRARVVSGRPLCAAIVDLLRVTGQPLTIPEIERLLRLQDLVPAGRASHTISNAISGEIRSGRIERVRRGCFRFSDAPGSSDASSL
jgi:hypothetical protein